MVKDFDKLTNSELFTELKASGLQVFPVTQTSRNYVIKKLQQCYDEYKEIEVTEDVDLLCSKISNILISPEEKFKKSELYYVVDSPKCQKVYKSLNEAVSVIKSSPGSRFYSFTSYDEADSVSRSFFSNATENFDNSINTSYFSALSVAVNPGLTSLVAWKTPNIRLLQKFRLNIETGHIREVIMMCTENPRYFVTSFDCPVILHEGLRRNAFHVIACHNQSIILKFMLRIIKYKIWQRVALIPEIREAQIDETKLDNIDVEKCAMKILDYYLNTPDKIMRETPLHLALKYGNIDVAEVLLNEKMVELFPVNKFNQSPYDVICNGYRGEGELELKKRLANMFETAVDKRKEETKL